MRINYIPLSNQKCGKQICVSFCMSLSPLLLLSSFSLWLSIPQPIAIAQMFVHRSKCCWFNGIIKMYAQLLGWNTRKMNYVRMHTGAPQAKWFPQNLPFKFRKCFHLYLSPLIAFAISDKINPIYYKKIINVFYVPFFHTKTILYTHRINDSKAVFLRRVELLEDYRALLLELLCANRDNHSCFPL